MNLLSQKSKEDSLNTLDEKQIQERLYGKYHKGNNSASVPSRIIPPPALTPKKSIPNKKKIDVAGEWKALAHAWAQAFRRYGANFPWKMAGSLGIILIAAVLIVQSVGGWLADRKFQGFVLHTQEISPSSEPSETLPSVSIPAQKVASPQAPPASHRGDMPAANPPAAKQSSETAAKQRFYAVQVCTYQRIRDAQELVKQLQTLHFSAFYKQSFSQAERIPLYVVFLDRVPSYGQAKTQLAEFRKTELFQKFSDSFIQSL